MLKKMLVTVLLTVFVLSCTAYAATYLDDDLSFDYDETLFDLVIDDSIDDEILATLTGKDASWGVTTLNIYLDELHDGEEFAKKEDFSKLEEETGTEVIQGEWNGFQDVIMFTSILEDGSSESVFIVPVYDDDGEIEDSMTIRINVENVEDEGIAMARDDAISAVLDSLKLLDD